MPNNPSATANIRIAASDAEGGTSLHASLAQPRIAVLIPCYNEALSIGQVVTDFAAALPTATIYVYDNNSTDQTREVARAAGAVVRVETHQGKGNVVRRMFADIEAEVYVLVDGDGTYDAASATRMVELLLTESLDLVNGARVPVTQQAFRPGHVFGNKLLTGSVAAIFGSRIRDMLSGYRVFSRRFVKSFPALASGFETETELTVHALELRLPIAEVQTPYRDRPSGSTSKLRTFRDGFRILRTILLLVKEERPLQFFTITALVLAVIGLALGIPVVSEFLRTGLVLRLPTAVLATGSMILAFISFVTGLILDTVTLARREIKRLYYLGLQGPTFRERRRGP
jgi:glycosyltransferase involved in cell wall biosynthesis